MDFELTLDMATIYESLAAIRRRCGNSISTNSADRPLLNRRISAKHLRTLASAG